MNYKKTLKRISLGIILLSASINLSAQDTKLKDQYSTIIENTETFKQYKVIPKPTLDAFFAQVADSVRTRNTKISQLQKQIDIQQSEIDSLKKQLNAIQVELDSSKKVNDSIYFMGIPFTKLGYHIMVWAIIVVLVVLVIVIYTMYARSNHVTTKSKKELQVVKNEFEQHKDKAREQQVRLKRELQTAVNAIDELKRGRR